MKRQSTEQQSSRATAQQSLVQKSLTTVLLCYCATGLRGCWATALILLSAVYCFAEEPQTFITSDSLEHEKSTSMYTARGSVLVEQGETIMMANEMKYDEKTSNIFAEGNVVSDNPDIILKAEKAEFNLYTKKALSIMQRFSQNMGSSASRAKR